MNISAHLYATASVVRHSALSLAVLGVMLGGFAGPVPAETVVVVGTDGAQGAFGNPGGNGGTGVTGQIAVAGAGTLNSNGDALNQATAQGGLGGLGGTGGNGFPIGVKSGNGGTGGTGGNAVADAVTSINSAASVATAIAIATGGRYGGGGGYGSAIFPGSIGANGLPGVGGNANAHATATNLGGDASATSEARGGGGFSSFNNNGGGGNAVAGATATASGAVNVRATAISGQQAGGFGGLANLDAVFGRSTGGGDVHVVGSATGAGGVNLVNVVDGETSGFLQLDQSAISVDGNSASSELIRSKSTGQLLLNANATGGRGTTGGAASSRADATNSGGHAFADLTIDGGDAGTVDGSGGTATGIANAFSSAPGRAAGVGYNIRGGAGGGYDSSTAGVAGGGAAAVTASATSSGDDGEASIFGVVRGGIGAGGTASSEANAIALNNGAVDIYTFTIGGTGSYGYYGAAGNGNSASAQANGQSAGAKRVSVVVNATGGMGGTSIGEGNRGGRGGEAVATAHGSSSGGGQVVSGVNIEGGVGGRGGYGAGDGGDAMAQDGVTGGTTGQLYLGLNTQGGAGGSSFGGAAGSGGNARTRLTGTNDLGADVIGNASARGGKGGGGYRDGLTAPNGGDGTVAISMIDSGNVDANAEASGGDGGENFGGQGGQGGAAHHGVVYGQSSGGGTVHVSLDMNGGDGGNGLTHGGNGVASEVLNGLDGDTEGALFLTQRATGGSAGAALDYQNVQHGTAGGAISTLSYTKQVQSFSITSEALGGNGAGGGGVHGTSLGSGADAVARATAVNTLGSAATAARATGGLGGGSNTEDLDGSQGGFADGEATATSEQAGESASAETLVIGGDGGGGPGFSDQVSTAVSGAGGEAVGSAVAHVAGDGGTVTVDGLVQGGLGGDTTLSGNGGAGGSARSESTGIADGDSAVTVNDKAVGGRGGHVFGNSGISPTGAAGAGAAAGSFASGRNVGSERVEVNATALGGAGGESGEDRFFTPRFIVGRGGDANAHADGASSAGAVSVIAHASGGTSGQSSDTAAARAFATGSGTSGSVQALADSRAVKGLLRSVSAQATGLGSTVHAHAEVRMGSAVPLAASVASTPVETLASVVTLPNGDAAAAALAGHVTNLTNFVAGSDVLGLGTLQGMTPGDTSGGFDHSYSAQVELQFDPAQLANAQQHLLLGLLDTSVALGFDTFLLTTVVEGVATTRSFNQLGNARSFFTDRTLDFGTLAGLDLGSNGLLDLSVSFQLHAHEAGAGFGFNFIVGNGIFVTGGQAPVSLPAPVCLLLSGLCGLGLAARRVRGGQASG